MLTHPGTQPPMPLSFVIFSALIVIAIIIVSRHKF